MTTKFGFAIVGYCAAMAVACTSLPETPTGNIGARDGGGTGGEDANVGLGGMDAGMDAAKGTSLDGPAAGRDTAVDRSVDVGDAAKGTVADGPASVGMDAALDLSADVPASGMDTSVDLSAEAGPASRMDTAVDLSSDAVVADSPQLSSCTPETDMQMCTRLSRVCGSTAALDNCGTTRTPNCGPASRLCSQDGLLGTCGGGTEICNAQGQWGTCSIQPAASGLDTCALGNDDNCNGIANQGCLCIEGATRTCGPCNDGSQACSNGKVGSYGACTGGTQQAVYYRDADGDGYGGTTTILACGGAPVGYVALGGDCCDTDPAANPGVPATAWFTSASKCGTFDYDCDGTVLRKFPTVAAGCALTGIIGCSDGGWSTAVAGCGLSGDWSECQQISSTSGTVLHISCVPFATSQTQACR